MDASIITWVDKKLAELNLECRFIRRFAIAGYRFMLGKPWLRQNGSC